MTLQRLEVKELPLVCEWDQETGMVGVAVAGDREIAWSRMSALHSTLHRESGVTWVDDELWERHKAVCGVKGMALVWRATFTPAAGCEWVPALISEAMGVRWEW